MRLDETVKHYLVDIDNRCGDLTLRSYTQRLQYLLRVLSDLCGVTEVEQATILHLRQCVQHLLTTPVEFVPRHGRKPDADDGILAISSVKAYIRVWKAFFSWCYQEELIASDPAVRLKHPKAPEKRTPAFVANQIDLMIEACDTSTDMGFRDYVILLLLLDTGIRIAEISNLRVDDVDLEAHYIKVTGKGRKDREVGIYPEMSKLLWKYTRKYRKPFNPDEQALFLGRYGRPLHSAGIHTIIKRIQRKTGLEDIKLTAHVFRHTFAKMYMESGGEIFKLSRELGHSSVQITEIYLRDFGSTEARKEHTAFSPLSTLKFKKQHGKRKPS